MAAEDSIFSLVDVVLLVGIHLHKQPNLCLVPNADAVNTERPKLL